MIIHRLVIDYTSHTISSNFFSEFVSGDKKVTLMVPGDNDSQIGIELVANQIYLLDSNWNIKNEMFRRLSYLSYSLGY